MEQRLFILFGKTGAGKNFTAEVFKKNLGYYWYDADKDLTLEMLDAIQHQTEFTQTMRDQYFEIVIKRMKQFLPIKEKIIMTQGLFKNKNRHDLMKEFPSAKWIWVDADQYIIDERVRQRKNMIPTEYARKINAFFEEPDFICDKILNNQGKSEILTQALTLHFKSSVTF